VNHTYIPTYISSTTKNSVLPTSARSTVLREYAYIYTTSCVLRSSIAAGRHLLVSRPTPPNPTQRTQDAGHRVRSSNLYGYRHVIVSRPSPHILLPSPLPFGSQSQRTQRCSPPLYPICTCTLLQEHWQQYAALLLRPTSPRESFWSLGVLFRKNMYSTTSSLHWASKKQQTFETRQRQLEGQDRRDVLEHKHTPDMNLLVDVDLPENCTVSIEDCRTR